MDWIESHDHTSLVCFSETLHEPIMWFAKNMKRTIRQKAVCNLVCLFAEHQEGSEEILQDLWAERSCQPIQGLQGIVTTFVQGSVTPPFHGRNVAYRFVIWWSYDAMTCHWPLQYKDRASLWSHRSIFCKDQCCWGMSLNSVVSPQSANVYPFSYCIDRLNLLCIVFLGLLWSVSVPALL